MTRIPYSSLSGRAPKYPNVKDIVNTNGNYHKLKAISQRYHVPNALYFLPFADRIMGVNECTPWEILHTINIGLQTYKVESFHDIIGEKDAGRLENTLYNQYYRIISRYMNQQSERDFPVQSSGADYTANTCMTAREYCGNQVVFLISCYVTDVKVLLERVFSKHNSTRSGIDGPLIKGCADAVESLLCYKKWIMEDKPVREVIAVTTRANKFR